MNRRLPSLSALRAFEATARHQSAKLAAQELSVTPTAVSHQLRQLEDTLGVALFIRKPRQLVLTPEGRAMQEVLSDAFDAIGGVVAQLRAQPQRQVITLSTTPAIAARWLLPWVCVLRDAHPDLDLRIHATHDAVALDGISADLAVRYGSGPWPGMVAEKLFDTFFIPACSPSLKLTDPAELPRHPLIHFEPQLGRGRVPNWRTWQQQAQVPGLDPHAGLSLSDETHTITAALDGQGVALMGKVLITDELRSGRLVQPFGPEIEGEPFQLVYPEQRRRDPLILAVREWVMLLRSGLSVHGRLRCEERESLR
jgi:LysR family glycine cleavage system transcriptional activator